MVTPEMVAINLRDASIPDNAGNAPRDEPVVPGGQTAYFTSVPIRKMVDLMKEGGIPCGISYSAGAYVCNDLFYSLRHSYEGRGTAVGFIHVPCLQEQSDDKRPGMSLDRIVRALGLAVRALPVPGPEPD